MISVINHTFHLQGKHYSYVFYISREGYLLSFHFGKKIPHRDYSRDAHLLLEPYPVLRGEKMHQNLSTYPQEYPTYGHLDMRTPALEVANGFGNCVTDLHFKDYKIFQNTALGLEQMPAVFASDGRCDTLQITLADTAAQIEVLLNYIVFEDFDVLVRSAVVKNCAATPVRLTKAYSFNIDLPINAYDVISFSGDWGRERRLERTNIHQGTTIEISDNTGRSTRWNNPFVMVCAPESNEEYGEVYGFNLIYSSNHSTVMSMDTANHLRVQQGISPQNFQWELQPGEAFETPQSAIAYSGSGFGALSQSYHRFLKQHLMRSGFVHRKRPVLINSWESLYFDFDEKKLLELARRAKMAGVELFVLDDGWFQNRDSARSSLGDWQADRRKLPDGLSGLAEKLNSLGLQFGLWIEPEMISPDSELYRKHPDWIVRVPQIDPVQYRFQYVLDLTKTEVLDFLIRTVSDVLDSANIAYIKWDMNRMIADTPRPGYYHEYALAYYRLLRTLTEKYPHILFEGCASGGGRFDAGVLAYMPQIWASDNTDAMMRLKIQYSTSFAYPISAICNHVSAIPNHQTGRITSLTTRANVAFGGIFGYELDLTKMTEEELAQVKELTETAKAIQPLVLDGDFYRLRSPYETNECIWELVSRDRSRAFVLCSRILAVIKRSRYYDPKIRLKGLDENAIYRDTVHNIEYSGSLLMNRGISVDYPVEDFATYGMLLERVGGKEQIYGG